MDPEYATVTATLRAFWDFHRFQYEHVIKGKRIKYTSLPEADRQLLAFYPDVLRNLEECVNINKEFTQNLALQAANDWGILPTPEEWANPSYSDFDKVRLTLLQLSREWSDEGEKERNNTFGRILEAAKSRIPPESRAQTPVLIPGCGAGRLVFDFVHSGFWTQGNEISYHMLFALGLMLNHVTSVSSHTVFPYIQKLLHVSRRLFQVRPVFLPDVSPQLLFTGDAARDLETGELMLMCAGSFVDLYGPPLLAVSDEYTEDAQAREFRDENRSKFGIVVTCFFLDTAANVIDYVRTIRHCLRDGGLWINLGPLHWHFEGDQNREMVRREVDGAMQDVQTTMEGLELSKEEVVQLVTAMGFDMEETESLTTTYAGDSRAMSNFVYGAEFWVAKKRDGDIDSLKDKS